MFFSTSHRFRAHWSTHSFRFDSRTNEIINIAIADNVSPLGEIEEVDIEDHLLLAARAVQRSILVWIAREVPILRGGKQLIFWGQADSALLLTRALAKVGQPVTPGLEVPLRYQIDCRIFKDPNGDSYVGLVADVQTTNVIDIPVLELMDHGVSIVGKYVCQRRDAHQAYLHPGLELLGRASLIRGEQLVLVDSVGMAITHSGLQIHSIIHPVREVPDSCARRSSEQGSLTF